MCWPLKLLTLELSSQLHVEEFSEWKQKQAEDFIFVCLWFLKRDLNPSSIQTLLQRSGEQMSSEGSQLFSGVLQWNSSGAKNSSSDCAVVVKWQ